MQRLICWLARAAGVAGIVFISLSALDVFEPGAPPVEALPALLVHLIPSLVLLAVLAIAWRRPLAGGVLFLVVSAVPFVWLHNPVAVNVMLAAPFAVTGLLFLACRALSGGGHAAG